MAATVQWSDCGQYWFDEAAAQAAVDFFPKYLRFTEGEWAGRPFVLEDWQADLPTSSRRMQIGTRFTW